MSTDKEERLAETLDVISKSIKMLELQMQHLSASLIKEFDQGEDTTSASEEDATTSASEEPIAKDASKEPIAKDVSKLSKENQ